MSDGENPAQGATAHGDGVESHLHRLAPVSLLALGLFGLYESTQLGLGSFTQPGPGLWPLLLAALVTICSVVLLFVDDRADYERWSKQSLQIFAGLAGLALYIIAFNLLGFAIATALMFAVWLRVFARESWAWTAGLTLFGTAALFLIFDMLLNVPFPEGLIFGAPA